MDENIDNTGAQDSLFREDNGSISQNQKNTENNSPDISDFPEGGPRAWLVVAGSAATMFCTFGYLTGFGSVD